jgi:hypothetical protein
MIQTTWCLTPGRHHRTVQGLHEQQDIVQGRYIQADQSLQQPFLTAFYSTPAPPPISTVATSTPPVLPAPSPFGSSLSMDSIIASGGSESAHDPNHSATHLQRSSDGSRANTDMAIDPRWNADVPEDKTQYFQSIANELDTTEIRFMPDPQAPSAVPMVGGSRNISDHEDAKPSAGRRSSMLKSRIKRARRRPVLFHPHANNRSQTRQYPGRLLHLQYQQLRVRHRRPVMPVPPVPGWVAFQLVWTGSSTEYKHVGFSCTSFTSLAISIAPTTYYACRFCDCIPPTGAPEPADGDWIGIAFVGAKG